MDRQMNGSIRRFCDYSPAQIEKMRAELGFRMPVAALRYCSDYYRTREKKRDPRIAELRLLDAMISKPVGTASAALTELYTNDPFVAVTYADMMNKRRELHSDASSPVMLTEALGMATAYLSRSGKKPGLPGLSPTLFDTQNTFHDFSDGSIGISGSAFTLKPNGTAPHKEALPGDFFVLLHSNGMSEGEYREKAMSLLRRPEISSAVKRTLRIADNGLLPAVLPLCRGLCFDLRRLTADGSVAPLEVLLQPLGGASVLLLPGAQTEPILKAAAGAGFRPMVFATVMNNDRTMFAFSASDSFSLETAFLRRFLPRAACAAKLPSEQTEGIDRAEHIPVSVQSCPYLLSGGSFKAERITNRTNTVSAAYCKTEHSFFRSAVQTVLCALLSTAAAGGDCADHRLAIGLDLPMLPLGDTVMGEAISTILGIYRVQTELGIPAAALAMKNSTGIAHPELTVYAISGVPGLPSHFVERENRIYCATVRCDEHGMPNFGEIRVLLTELVKLNARRAIRSVRVICGEDPETVLSAMAFDRLSYRIDTPSEVDHPLPLAILMESSEDLPFTCIGRVELNLSPSETEAEELPALPDPADSLIWNETNEAVIFAGSSDGGASALASYLRENGMKCTVWNENATENEFSRAVLTARLLLVCGPLELPDGARMRFALRTMTAAGGSVLCLGETAKLPEDIRPLRFPDGVPEEIFTRFFRQKAEPKNIL